MKYLVLSSLIALSAAQNHGRGGIAPVVYCKKQTFEGGFCNGTVYKANTEGYNWNFFPAIVSELSEELVLGTTPPCMNYTELLGGETVSSGRGLFYVPNSIEILELDYGTSSQGACTGMDIGGAFTYEWTQGNNTYQSAPAATWTVVSDCVTVTTETRDAPQFEISKILTCTAKNTATVAPSVKIPGAGSITTYNSSNTCTGSVIQGEGFTQSFDSGSCLPYEPTNNSYKPTCFNSTHMKEDTYMNGDLTCSGEFTTLYFEYGACDSFAPYMFKYTCTDAPVAPTESPKMSGSSTPILSLGSVIVAAVALLFS